MVVTIPGMEDEDPKKPGEGGPPGSGGDADQLDGQGGDNGDDKASANPLTSLFQKTMSGGGSEGDSGGDAMNMSLSNFLNQIVNETNVGENGIVKDTKASEPPAAE